jgi:two-component system OmpR family response regulator
MKLLVVEDDSELATAVTSRLRAEGFTVDVALDGNDGWWMATENGYDLIVLDLMLPCRDGLTICRELRAAGNWTPVLVMTARDGELDQVGAFDVGADDYLAKPVSLAVLLARIRSILRRHDRRGGCSTVGGLRIDSAARQVWSSGCEVALTRREFDVLEFLMRRAGEAVSKEQILQGVWEFDFEGDPNIVQVYITRLRRKLDAPFGTDHIHTARGAGYRLHGHVG